MKIYRKDDGYLPSEFIKYGLDHCQTSIDIFSKHSPNAFDSAAYLMHLGLEQILKAWHLEVFGQFESTHSLTVLKDGLTAYGIEIAPQFNIAFEEIDSYEKIKYPQNVQGIEVGNNNLNVKVELINSIYKQLPERLKQEDNSDYKTKGGRILMRKLIDKTEPSHE